MSVWLFVLNIFRKKPGEGNVVVLENKHACWLKSIHRLQTSRNRGTTTTSFLPVFLQLDNTLIQTGSTLSNTTIMRLIYRIKIAFEHQTFYLLSTRQEGKVDGCDGWIDGRITVHHGDLYCANPITTRLDSVLWCSHFIYLWNGNARNGAEIVRTSWVVNTHSMQQLK